MEDGIVGGEAREDKDTLVTLAREAIEAYVRERRVIRPSLPAECERRRAGTFVSLHLPDGSLRGCIGTTEPYLGSVEEEIVANAISAATGDPRFYPVTEQELAGLDISVDVLGPAEEVKDLAEMDPKRYGMIVRTLDGRRALLLPDLEGVDTVDQQLRITCRKGSIDPDADQYRIYRFEVQRHH
jgi:AmmeMemoRadiSam system protein A